MIGTTIVPEPRVSGEQAVRALERLGFVQVARHGVIAVLRRAGDDTAGECVVPLQDEIPAGALMGILRQADVSHEEFYASL